MKSANITESLHDMQRMLLPASAVSEAVRKGACDFWESQDKLLDSMEAFAEGWFERRHTGTHVALEAAERMCKAQTPIDLLREYQDWASGAFQRVMADGIACQKQFMEGVGVLGQPWTLWGESAVNTRQAETVPTRSKAA